MEVNRVINGLALDEVSKMPDKSVDCVITSPPYWNLRDYQFSEQWGLEKTYKEYLDNLISLMKELKRVLKDEGTIWVNLGDTYSTQRGQTRGKAYPESTYLNNVEMGSTILKGNQGMPNKCLMLIPHRFAIRCIDELGLILRNDIKWLKPNSMPESVTDRFSKKSEYVFFFVKQKKYYFDLDSIRDKSVLDNSRAKILGRGNQGYTKASGGQRDHSGGYGDNNGFKNPGDVSHFWDSEDWVIPTRPSSEKHYATFNTDLIDKPIIAGCPEGGIILDPFAGTATTLIRAIQLNRNAIGIEGNKEYAGIAQQRLDDELSQPNFFNDAVNL